MPQSARRAQNCTIYRDGDKFVMDTGKSPRQFQGVLSIVYTGTSAETLEEAVYPSDQLRALPTLEPQHLPPDMRKRLGELGLLVVVASKPTSGSRASAPRRVQSRGQRLAQSPRRTRQPALHKPVGWRDEYRTAIWKIWDDGWCFLVTPLVVVWLPFALGATALWSAAALIAYIEERLGA